MQIQLQNCTPNKCSYLAAVAVLAITGLTTADIWLGVLLVNFTAAKPVRAQLGLTITEMPLCPQNCVVV